MRRNDSRSVDDLDVAYTDRPRSGWGGLLSFVRYMSKLGVRECLEMALPDGRTSPNQVPVADMVLQLMVTVLTGGSRFAHVSRFHEDEVMRAMLGAERLGSAMTITRYFGAFTPKQTERMNQVLQGLIRTQLAEFAREEILDLDSTVMTRYGRQEGSAKGYNPQRPGRLSHHPLLAMLAHSKLLIHSWLRTGSASPLRGASEFLVETLAGLPKGCTIQALRADSGFFSNEFLTTAERHSVPYVISMKMSRPVQRWAAQSTSWEEIEPGLEIRSDLYHPHHWAAARRVVVVRKLVRRREKTAGASKTLFTIADWDYSAFVTSLDLSPIEVWRLYNRRGDCENRIKELKGDFHANGFCLRSFPGTEAVFRLNCFLFNLVACFKRDVLRDTKLTLGTIRSSIFVVGAALVSSGRQRLLRLGLTGQWKHEFDRLLARVVSLARSTVAQFQNLLTMEDLNPPSPWRLRRPAT